MEVTEWFFVVGCICAALLIGFVIGMFFVGFMISEPEEELPELPNRSPRRAELRPDIVIIDDLDDCNECVCPHNKIEEIDKGDYCKICNTELWKQKKENITI